MSTETITAATVLNDLLLPRWPVPANLFERALWCERLETTLGELIPLFNRQYHDLVTQIARDGLVSDIYELQFPFVTVRRVDTPRVRSELPAVYDQIAHLRLTDAERILGRQSLYELCRTAAPERAAEFAQINLADLAWILIPAEMEQFVLTKEKPARPVIVPRESA